METVMLKTHLIVSDVHEEYYVKWLDSIANAKPMFKNNLPIFVVVGTDSRMELNTLDIKRIEDCAKRLTHPHGREAVTTAVARIYIKEEGGHEKFIGKVIHNHVKQYQQMYDKFEKG